MFERLNVIYYIKDDDPRFQHPRTDGYKTLIVSGTSPAVEDYSQPNKFMTEEHPTTLLRAF